MLNENRLDLRILKNLKAVGLNKRGLIAYHMVIHCIGGNNFLSVVNRERKGFT